jgi:hypothetical protein
LLSASVRDRSEVLNECAWGRLSLQGQKFWCFVRVEGMKRDAAKEWTASTRTERVVSGTAVDQPLVKEMWC